MAIRVCFLGLRVYPILAGFPDAYLGGAEVQQCLIASYLARRGYQVSCATWDYGQPDEAEVEGITFYKTCEMKAGMRYLRYFHPRWTSLWDALRRADAEVYYQRCAGAETGLVAAFCRRHDRKFVFSAASETDFDLERAIIPRWFDRRLYVYGLRQANAIIAQTETQRAMLRSNFGLEAQLIPNCWAEKPVASKQPGEARQVIWVGTLRDWKRPGLFLDLANSLPEVSFVMVGPPAATEMALYDQVEQRARKTANLSFAGLVPFNESGQYFDRALLVVNTSEPKEGFPNTFLQAWCRGIPVVSFFDPDGIIGRYQLGLAVDSPDAMRQGVLDLLQDANLYRRIQLNTLKYFQANHRIEMLGLRYETLFDGLAG